MSGARRVTDRRGARAAWLRRLSAWLAPLAVAAWAGSAAAQVPDVTPDVTPEVTRDVLPILAARCGECHGSLAQRGGKAAKAGLRLDSVAGLAAGSTAGPVVRPGDSGASPLVQRLLLPDDDLDRMPPRGPGVPADEVAVLAAWIRAGADLGGLQWPTPEVAGREHDRGTSAGSPTLRLQRWQALAEQAGPADVAALAQARDAGLLIELALPPSSALLRAGRRANGEPLTDADLRWLAPLATHLVALDLARSALTDAGLQRWREGLPRDARGAALPALTRLDLSGTSLGAAGLEALLPAPALERLLLVGAACDGPRAVDVLARLPAGAELFLFDSGVDDTRRATLASLRPDLRLHGPPALPAALAPEPEALAEPRRRR